METISRNLLTFMLNALWQVPLAAAVAALGGWMMRRGPAWHRHALWVAALFAAFLLPLGGIRVAGDSTADRLQLPAAVEPAAVTPAAAPIAVPAPAAARDRGRTIRLRPRPADSCCWPTCRSSPGAWRGSPSPPLEPSACAPPLPRPIRRRFGSGANGPSTSRA